ncbi:MAG: DUF1820 family protein [Immundisolibacter sp.]|uniref:DUF1820 family protein n=1 Tax=Immundisolibacter sp. TaxID=1934948 RepID=UPI003564D3BB
MPVKKKPIYKVSFHNQGKLYELHAREVSQGSMFGFIEVAGFVFGEKSSLVIDPSEERLKAEFEHVKTTFIPMHAVVRIDEVDREGVNKISNLSDDAKVAYLPSPIYTPSSPGGRGKD